MAKVITDEKLIDKFLTRGVEAIYPSREALKEKLMSGVRMRIYQGFDPTGPFLHVGHAMGIRALKILQQLGHEVIFLVGDYTSKVGDPDKEKTRKMLTDEEIEKNMAGWKEQAGQMIDFEGENPVQFKRNYEWLSRLKMEDIIKLMSKITVQRMLERDMFERRIKEDDPIGLQEFIYPLMQGYDGVAMEVDMEIGGADQTFNMLTGRKLSKAYLGKEKFVRTNKMMEAPDGITMSKTKGNGINLGDSAKDMFGKAMSYPDNLIISGLELLTDMPDEEIKDVEQKMKKGENPMIFKKQMAFGIVKLIKGEKQALEAQDYFETTFSKKQTPKWVEAYEAHENILDFMISAGLAKSRSDARRKIEQGGVSIDGNKVGVGEEILTKELHDEKVMKVGPKDFVRIKF